MRLSKNQLLDVCVVDAKTTRNAGIIEMGKLLNLDGNPPWVQMMHS